MTQIKLPEKWKEWEILTAIGSGSCGTVYKLQRKVGEGTFISAMKVIQIPRDRSELDEVRSTLPNEASVYNYFEKMVQAPIREIRLMDHLKGNSNIVSVQDFFVEEKKDEIGWTIYILMEYLQSLTVCLNREKLRKLSENEIIRIGTDICAALEDCAKYHIIHRDIKPDNIFKSELGKYKLGDFGVARELDQNASTVVGTFSYMAPEVFLHKKYGAQADIYSLGIMLYRLGNNNRDPFVNPYKQILTYEEREKALRRRMRGDEFPPPAGLSANMAEILKKACAFRPEDRYRNAAEMKKALEALSRQQSDTGICAAPNGKKAAQAEDRNEHRNEFRKEHGNNSGKGYKKEHGEDRKKEQRKEHRKKQEKERGKSVSGSAPKNGQRRSRKASVVLKWVLVLIAAAAGAVFFTYLVGYLAIVWKSSSSAQTAPAGETAAETTEGSVGAAEALQETDAAAGAATETDPAALREEILSAAESIWTQMKAYAGNDYEAFSALFCDTPEEEIQKEYEMDFQAGERDKTNYIYLGYTKPYALAAVCDYGVSGEKPAAGSYHLILKKQDGEWKLCIKNEFLENPSSTLMDNWLADILPEGYLSAYEAERNCFRNKTCYALAFDSAAVFENCFDQEVVYLWQQEDDSVVLGVWLGNGTDADMTTAALEVAVTDKEQGTVIDAAFAEECSVPAGASTVVYLTVSADQVQTKTAAWGDLSLSADCSFE